MSATETTLLVIALAAVAIAAMAVIYSQREPARADISVEDAARVVAWYYGLGA